MSITSSFKFLLPAVLIPLILVSIWFRNGLITGGGEEGILFYNPQKVLQLSTSVWVEYATGGSGSSWLSRSPIIFLALAWEKIGIPLFVFQMVLFWILLVVGTVSVYFLSFILLEKYPKRESISLVSALFYLFNPFSISQVWARGLYGQYFSFTLLPLALLLFILGIKKRMYIFSFLLTLSALLLASAFGFITFIIVYWFALFIFLLFNSLVTKDKSTVIFGIKFFLLTFILWLSVHSWWLMPFVSSATERYSINLAGLEDNLGTLLGVSRNFTPDILIRLLQRTYFFDPSAFSPVYSTLFFQTISFIPVLFVSVGIFKILREKTLINYKFALILFFIGLVVSLGANPPFSWLFVWVFKNILVLQAFRNPFEKFGLVYALGYSLVFALGILTTFEKFKIRFWGTFFVLLFTYGIYAWPMWTGRVVASPDGKIGLPVPNYYRQLDGWLREQKLFDERIFMTPLWVGPGAFYLWDGHRYGGVDPMVFILNQTSISNTLEAPLYFEFMQQIKKYAGRVNIVPALSLLRTRYLVNRGDATFITDREKEEEILFTSKIYPPSLEKENIICQNLSAKSQADGPAWLFCQIQNVSSNWHRVRYLKINVKTDQPANLEIALRDKQGTRIRWDGRVAKEYSTTNDWTEITIPLNAPTEYNYQIDFSNIMFLELLAHPLNKPQLSINEIFLKDVNLDPGKEEKIDEFNLVKTFDKLNVYTPLNFNPPPEFGSLSTIEEVTDFVHLFDQLNKKRDTTDERGFLLMSQNQDKNLKQFKNEEFAQVIDKKKISNTRYWLKTGDRNLSLIILSKTFDPSWKVIPQVEKEKLLGNIFDDLKLLKSIYVGEKDHFVVNGYANLWKVDGRNTQYAIVFLPQVIADIGWKVSVVSVVLFTGVTIIWGIRKYISSH